MLRPLLVLSLSLALTCSSTPEKTEETTKPDGPGPSEVVEPEVEGPPIARAATPELPDCPADADADTYCTEAGKLAGRWSPVDTVHRPASAQPIFESAHHDLQKQPSLTISLDKDTLYIEKVTCGSCRRVIGHGFVGSLTALSDDHLRALQTKLGLPADAPLLDSPEAWRIYVTQDPGKSALTKIATATDP